MINLKSCWAGAPVLAMAFAASACDQGLTDVNVNPNDPEVVAPEYLLANAITSSVGGDFGTHGPSMNLYLASIWPQHLTQVKYNEEEPYKPRTLAGQSIWNNFYSGPLADLADVKRIADDTNDPNLAAVAEVISQYDFQVLTDMFGDIPYSQALKGRGAEVVRNPAYDTQKDVYYGMLAALTAANGQITAGGAASWAAGDLVYDGNMTRWKRFANSLRMRMAMRIADVDPAKARTEFVAAYQAGGFQSNADNAELVWTAAQPSQNPIYDYFYNQDRFDNVVSETLVDTLAALHDPRLEVYAEPAETDHVYRGLRNGDLPADYGLGVDDYSNIGVSFLAANAPSVMMSYAEVLFLQAEAAARGWIPADAGTLYRQAITASMEQNGIAAATIAAYLARPGVAYGGRPAIGLQKWIALFMNGPEAWAEVRRTNYPLLTPVVGNTIALRIPYPNQEQTLNRASVEEAIARQNEALSVFGRLWWDVN
jgi:hypothetical protein